jgi:hypothetical protein
MATYGDLIDRIADETVRSDLSDQIEREIISAIKYYERRRFYFNETVSSLTLSTSQEWYSSTDLSDIPNFVEIDSIKLTVSQTLYPLIRRPYGYIEQVQSSTNGPGDPTDYTYYRQQLRFYPIPQQQRMATISYVKREATLSATTDSNAWTNDAEELIRARAKASLTANVIRDLEMAAVYKGQEAEALSALDQETILRLSSGRVMGGM